MCPKKSRSGSGSSYSNSDDDQHSDDFDEQLHDAIENEQVIARLKAQSKEIARSRELDDSIVAFDKQIKRFNTAKEELEFPQSLSAVPVKDRECYIAMIKDIVSAADKMKQDVLKSNSSSNLTDLKGVFDFATKAMRVMSDDRLSPQDILEKALDCAEQARKYRHKSLKVAGFFECLAGTMIWLVGKAAMKLTGGRAGQNLVDTGTEYWALGKIDLSNRENEFFTKDKAAAKTVYNHLNELSKIVKKYKDKKMQLSDEDTIQKIAEEHKRGVGNNDPKFLEW